MKTAIYIEDGVMQLVITPESKFEKDAIGTLENKKIDAKIMFGSFYDCLGGWTRQTATFGTLMHGTNEDQSLILRVAEDTMPQRAV